MAGLSLDTVLMLGVIAVLATALILIVVSGLQGRRHRSIRARPADDQAMFLFQDQILLDATPAGRHLLLRHGGRGSDWDQLLDQLSRLYPGLRDGVTDAVLPGQYLSRITGDDSILQVETWRDLMRITLHEASNRPAMVHPLAVGALEEELETLRGISHASPHLMWKQDQTGAITWANSAYLAFADTVAPAAPDNGPVWPPHRVFATLDSPADGQSITRRVAVPLPRGDEQDWFEVKSQRTGSETVHFAANANDAVLAERQGRKFVQTLTKTFAQLPIGLAIFDRQRHLVMFNPALLDLTRLPVEFLSGRPLVAAFLDRLRDRNMLPEPKDYISWREQVAALETAAVAGTYCESWALPGGQTYRVTGRPHPDGAIAFTFEDITAEIALTRAFRTELETAQNVLEAMDEAIAVFSGAGTLTMSNAAYSEVWGHSAETLDDITLRGEIGLWQERTAPSPLWKSLTQSARTTGRPKASRTTIRMTDGRSAMCRCVPIGGGSTLVAFQILGQAARPIPEIEDEPLPELVFRHG